MRGRIAVRVAVAAAVIAALGWFAYANMEQPVDLRFGLFTLHAVPLPIVVYGALLIGMLAMMAVSLRNDLRTRQALRRYDEIARSALADVEAEEPDRPAEPRASL